MSWRSVAIFPLSCVILASGTASPWRSALSKLREIAGNAFVNLRQPPQHLGLGEVPIPRADGFELAAVDRNARLAE
jgi:hypothetical protein